MTLRFPGHLMHSVTMIYLVGQNWIKVEKTLQIPQATLSSSINFLNALSYYWEFTVIFFSGGTRWNTSFLGLMVSALAMCRLCFMYNIAKVGKC